MPAASTCRLRVIRRSGYADYLRSYKIFVNGMLVGTIAPKGILDVDVPSGQLTIEARVDWGRSQALAVAAAPNQTIEIEVANNWGALLALWATTFGSRTYLTLKHLRTR
jgi:hypothetical protein